ncbi:hypothetical protein LJC34_05185 [Oscillospiraceae bacterium OttesenSCG-928-G22]|nr:hypothetical protein [Oscillospiraceae bacterium OttesenSCG-928-G22]
MQIKELHRKERRPGKTVAEYEVGKLIVRLIDTYDSQKTLEDMLYIIACRKLEQRLA